VGTSNSQPNPPRSTRGQCLLFVKKITIWKKFLISVAANLEEIPSAGGTINTIRNIEECLIMFRSLKAGG